VELSALLDEATVRAARSYEASAAERKAHGQDVPELSEAEKQTIAEVVGLGAVKYADLSQNRTSDYVFNWDKMLAMDGNTATYMQYAFTRICGIFRKGGEDVMALRRQAPLPLIETPQERALALELVRFADALGAAAAEYKPNFITAYLWDLTRALSGFYQNCKVLDAGSPDLRRSRLLLCDLTGRTIRQGLDLLGIGTVERM